MDDEFDEFDDDLFDDEAENTPPPTHTQHQDLISPDQIPMQMTVEIGRMRLPLSHVLELKPGNILDLAVRPEEGVKLTVGGKVVASGELIAIGDVLGVKITDIG